MAERTQADDEFNPRHRIVGAVILVALAVVLLPMVLNDQPPDGGEPAPGDVPVADARSGPGPSPDVLPGGVLPAGGTERPLPAGRTRIVTVPVEPVAVVPPVEPAAGSVVRAPVESPVAAAEPVRPEARPAGEPAAAAGAGKAAGTAVAASGGWIVQVGVFSQADNARRLEQRLKAKGYAVLLDPPGAPRGKPVRVEVGPYRDQSAARAAAVRIERDFAIKGIVRAH